MPALPSSRVEQVTLYALHHLGRRMLFSVTPLRPAGGPLSMKQYKRQRLPPLSPAAPLPPSAPIPLPGRSRGTTGCPPPRSAAASARPRAGTLATVSARRRESLVLLRPSGIPPPVGSAPPGGDRPSCIALRSTQQWGERGMAQDDTCPLAGRRHAWHESDTGVACFSSRRSHTQRPLLLLQRSDRAQNLPRNDHALRGLGSGVGEAESRVVVGLGPVAK
jgi:hypothetical protein